VHAAGACLDLIYPSQKDFSFRCCL